MVESRWYTACVGPIIRFVHTGEWACALLVILGRLAAKVKGSVATRGNGRAVPRAVIRPADAGLQQHNASGSIIFPP